MKTTKAAPAQDDTPEAESLEWWKMQAERLKDEVDQVTTAAREKVQEHATEIAAVRQDASRAVEAEHAKLVTASEGRQTAEAELAKAKAVLAAHQQAMGDILATMGPSLARVSQLLQG